MPNQFTILKYILWLSLLIGCAFLFFSGANNNTFFSIPIEAFPIPLAASLILAAYLLNLKSKVFRFLLWAGLLASTASIVWFTLLYIANPYGTEATITLYSMAITIMTWLQLKNYRTNPN